MCCGPVEFAALAVHDSDHQIAVSDIAAAADRVEDLPAGCQQAKRVLEPSLLPAHLREKQHGLGLAVRIAKPSTQLQALFEAAGSVGQPVLAPVGAGQSG